VLLFFLSDLPFQEVFTILVAYIPKQTNKQTKNQSCTKQLNTIASYCFYRALLSSFFWSSTRSEPNIENFPNCLHQSLQKTWIYCDRIF